MKAPSLGQFEDGAAVGIDLPKLLETRLLVQANSGGGKSWLLRRRTAGMKTTDLIPGEKIHGRPLDRIPIRAEDTGIPLMRLTGMVVRNGLKA